MSLRQMEYLVAVVEEESFTRAAELLNVTQSALSHQIKALERDVGGPLLERRPRGIGLTPMGRAFLPHAELAVRSAEQARRAAKAAAGAAGGELHIASLHALAVGVLPPVFARWRRAFPAVRLHLHEYASTEELRDHMERGVADVAVGPRPEGWHGPVVPLGHEEIMVITSAGDPLAARTGPVALSELAGRDWVRCALEPVVEGKRWLDWLCERAGFTPRTAVWTEHSSTAVRMAVAGMGLVTAPVHMARDVPGAVTVPVDRPWRREQTAFTRVGLTGSTAAFVELCRELAFAEPAGHHAAGDRPAGGQTRTSSATG